MKRVLALAVALCLAAGGCGYGSAPYDNLQAQRTVFLIFALDHSAGEVPRMAAQTFAQKVEELSAGSISVELQDTSELQRELTMGHVQVALLDSWQSGGFSREITALSEPFRFRDYFDFTMSCNAPGALEELSEKLSGTWGIVPLKAYYQGCDYIFSSQRKGNWIAQVQDGSLGMSGQETVLNRPGSNGLRALEPLVGEVREEPDAALRMELLQSGEIWLTEFSFQELSELTWPGMDLYAYPGYHNINPLWLLANDTFYEQLTPRQKAIFEEAGDYLFGQIDQYYRDQEEALSKKFWNWGYQQEEESAKINLQIRERLEKRPTG